MRALLCLAACAALLPALPGCDPVVSDDTMGAVVDTLGLAPAAPPATDGATTVYLDRSASIQPYVNAGGVDGTLAELLTLFDGAYGARFRSFGFAAAGATQTVGPLPSNPIAILQPANFVDVNNDYGALFERIAREETGLHLVLSDGVQSDPDEGARYRPIVEPIRDWLAGGRVFAVMTFRVPYRGTYYSEVRALQGLGTAVPFSCDDRPLHVFAFLPSEGALRGLRENLAAVGLAPDFELAVGPPIGALEPLERPAGLRGAKDLLGLEGSRAASAWPAFSARPNLDDAGEGHLPFVLRPDSAAVGWAELDADARRQVLTSAEVSVAMVPLGNLRRDPPAPGEPGRPVRAALAPDSAGAVAVARVPIAPPVGGTHVAWLAEGRLTPLGAQALVPRALTTQDDREPSSCGQTLTFDRLLGAILQEHYLLGRALVVTEQ